MSIRSWQITGMTKTINVSQKVTSITHFTCMQGHGHPDKVINNLHNYVNGTSEIKLYLHTLEAVAVKAVNVYNAD